MLTLRGTPVYNRFGSWFVLIKKELKYIHSNKNSSVSFTLKRLRAIGFPENESLVSVCSYICFYDEIKSMGLFALTADLYKLKKKNSQNAFVLQVCNLLPFLIRKGHPNAVAYFEERVEQNLKMKCHQIRELSAGIETPIYVNCINCLWGRKYARKGIIL